MTLPAPAAAVSAASPATPLLTLVVTGPGAAPETDWVRFADDAVDDAHAYETEMYDGHAEDMLDPIHGSDLDPCAICDPECLDAAVAALHDFLADRAETPVAA